VPIDTTANDGAEQKPAGDLPARLRDIRAKVTSLRERLATERDPKLVDAINAEVKKLSDLLSELIQAAGNRAGTVSKADPVVWPRDLCAEPNDPGEWGADPAEGNVE
jgi:hypothetical protein